MSRPSSRFPRPSILPRRWRPWVEPLEARDVPAPLVFTKQPIGGSQNQYLNAVTVTVPGGRTADVTLSLGNNPGGGILGGTVTRSAVNGTAVFSDLYIYGGAPAQGVTLVATAPGPDQPGVSSAFEVKPGPSHLAVAAPFPTAVVAGNQIGPVKVQVLQSTGSVDAASDGETVSLYLANNPGGARFVNAQGNAVAGPLTAKTVKGVATFSDVRLDKAGVGYTLAAEAEKLVNVRPVTSNRFDVTAGAAAGLVFEQPPATPVVNEVINGGGAEKQFQQVGVTVRVVDKFNNPRTTGTDTVTLSLRANPANGKFVTATGADAPPPTATAVNGLARFTDLRINQPGTGYVIDAASGTLTAGASPAFPVVPLVASKLRVLTAITDPVPVGGKLPDIRVQLLDAQDRPVTNDSTTRVYLSPRGNLLGTTVVTAVNGVATFTNLYVQGRTLTDEASRKLDLRPGFEVLPYGEYAGVTVTLTAGSPAALLLEDPAGALAQNIVAGDYLKASTNQPVRVRVVDAFNNTVTTDNGTRVSVGLLRNGAHPQPTFIGFGPTPGAADGLRQWATVTAKNGIADFSQLYVNTAGEGYQLSVGTTDLPFEGIASTPFPVAIGAAASLRVLSSPAFTNDKGEPVVPGALRRIGANGAGFPGYPLTPIVVDVVDRVGNRVTNDNSTRVTIDLPAAQIPANGGPLMGVKTLTVSRGLAFFDQIYIDQTAMQVVPGYNLTVTASAFPAAPKQTGAFSVAPPPNVPVPDFVVTQQPKLENGKITFAAKVSKGGTPANAYDGLGVVKVHLIREDGSFVFGVPDIEGVRDVAPVNGVAAFAVTLTPTAKPGDRYKFRLLSEVGALAVVTDVYTVPAAALDAAATADAPPPTAPPPPVVNVGYGSYTNNFDYVTTFPDYSQKADGSPRTVQQQFFQPSYQSPDGATTPPAAVRPNVTADFAQVPQSNEWWSSVMFPRVSDALNPDHDSRNNVLYPMFANPLTVMVNGAGSPAGIGIGYLKESVFYPPTPQYLDNPALLPPGQPRSLEDPRFPGADNFAYRYAGTNKVSDTSVLSDTRMYQDLAVTLPGVAADAKVKAYSDWTVTLDWDGKLQATLGQGLPFSYFTTTAAADTPVALTTARPGKTVAVTAFNAAGQQVTAGTGAVKLVVTYTVNELSRTGEIDPKTGGIKIVPLTVRNVYGVFLPTGVAWALADGTLSATLPKAKNYFSVAVLPDDTPAVFTEYRKRGYTHVTGSTSAFTFDEAKGTLTTTFRLLTADKETGGDLLSGRPIQGLYSHQYHNLGAGLATGLSVGGAVQQFSYASPMGLVRVFDGAAFSTVLTHRGVLPQVPPAPDANGYYKTLWADYLLPFLVSVSQGPRNDGTLDLARLLRVPSDNYLEAQQMYGAAELVPLLLQVADSKDPGLTAADKGLARVYAERVFNAVKDRMSAWLSAADDRALQLLYYQAFRPNEAGAGAARGWQSLMSLLPGFESSNSLNDHNLIAGYFIKAASVIARYDRTWGDAGLPTENGRSALVSRLGDVIRLLIKDVSNYSRADRPNNPDPLNPSYPFLRNFDPFAGHSWVDGAANSELGNNQESSSESLNYAAALIQWGEAVGDPGVRDLGVYLYNTEIESVYRYYFDAYGQDQTFPDGYAYSDPDAPDRDVRPVVSKLNGAGGQYSGFIGSNTTALAGIQMIPVSGSAYYLGRFPQFVRDNYAQAVTSPVQGGAVPVAPPPYLTVLIPYRALVDADKALNDPTYGFYANEGSMRRVNPGFAIDSLSPVFHWVKTLEAYGQVDATVTANVVSYTVFVKAGVRTFVVSNAGRTPLTGVQFKDATGAVLLTMDVPGLTTLVVRANADKKPVPVAAQTAPDLSLRTPADRFFFSSDGGTNGFKNGATGTGERAVSLPAPNGPQPSPTPANSVSFTVSGVTGTYKGGDAQAAFQLWVDPQFAKSGSAVPVLKVRVTYYTSPADQVGVTHEYNRMPLSLNSGYVLVTNPDIIVQQGMTTIPKYPLALNNGRVVVTVWAAEGNANAVRLRTDAAGEQGRVSFLDLPYNITSVAKPTAAPAAAAFTAAAVPPTTSGDAGTGFVATLAGTTATFTGYSSADEIRFGTDRARGVLTHNRFGTDPGFASEADFDSTVPGEQALAADAAAAVVVQTGGGADTVTLGDLFTAASELAAKFTVVAPDGTAARLVIDDSGYPGDLNYVVTDGGVSAAGRLAVEYGAGLFGGGIELVTAGTSQIDHVLVRSTRAGEALTLTTAGGDYNVTVGDGSTANVRGDVSIVNPVKFTHVEFDNSTGPAPAGPVTISPDGVTGLSPGAVRFAASQIADIEVFGGAGGASYRITESIAGSFIRLVTADAADRVIVGNGVVSDATIHGKIVLDGVGGTLTLDNSKAPAADVTLSATGVTGLGTLDLVGLPFPTVEVLLGDEADAVAVDGTLPGVAYVVRAGGGDDVFTLRGGDDAVTLDGQAGNDKLVLGVPATALVPEDARAEWAITGENAGTVTGPAKAAAFLAVENLVGWAARDTFTVAAGGAVAGNLDGAGGDNVLSYAGRTDGVAVNLQAATATGVGGTFQNVGRFVGGAGADAITGPNAATEWKVAADGTGTAGGTPFAGFEVLNGGSGPDTFTVAPGAVGLTVNGNLPGPGANPGDRLTLDFAGVTGSKHTPGAAGAGVWASANRQPVAYTGIEALTNAPRGLTVSVTPAALVAGAGVTAAGGFATDDTGRAHTVTINWGDGSPDTVLTLPAGALAFTASHTFPATLGTGDRAVRVTVANAVSGATDAASASVAVTAVVPKLVGFTVTPGVQLGGDARLTGTLRDATAPTPVVVTVAWGDGTTDTLTLPAGATTFDAAHRYTRTGAFAVAVTVGGGSATAEVRVSDAPADGVFAAGAGAGGGGTVVVLDRNGNEKGRLTPFPGFGGGVRVAVGDVTGDGTDDLVAAAGPGGGPHVRVFDTNTFTELASFYAFEETFRGGVAVAVGDVTGDGVPDIVAAAGAGGGPRVRVFDGRTFAEVASFYAFEPGFLGGVTVAVGDVTGDGIADVIAGAGAGGGPRVRAFRIAGAGPVEVASFLAFDADFRGGVYVAAGDLFGRGVSQVVVGTGPGGETRVVAFDVPAGSVKVVDLPAFEPSFTGGVRVATSARADGGADLVLSPGSGGGPRVRVVNPATGAEVTNFLAFPDDFTGGVFVG